MFLVGFLLFTSICSAANYVLDIINVDEVGANNRIRWQYTGIEYDVRIAAKGGLYPFTWELVAAPLGMTINSSTGQVNWTSPTTGNHTVTVKVTDDESSTDQESYTLQVIEDTDTDPDNRRFHFLDAVNGNDSTGNGTLASPWKTMGAIYTDGETEQYPGDLVYLRTGTYTWPHVPQDPWTYVVWFDTDHVIGFIGYPGESITINGEDSGDGSPPTTRWTPRFEYPPDIWFSNINFDNSYGYVVAITDCHYFTFYDNTVTDFRGGTSGSNSSAVCFTGGLGYNYAILANTFYDVQHNDEYSILCYGNVNTVIEDNIQYGDWGRLVGVKCDTDGVFIRHNQVLPDGTEYPRYGVHIMHCAKDGIGGTLNTEISFNFFKASERAVYSMDCCGFQLTGPGYVYRNTIYDFNVGTSHIWYGDYVTGSGVETIYNNVIINDNPEESGTPGTDTWYKDKCRFQTMTAAVFSSKFSFSNNLLGVYANNIVDSDGLLQGTYREQYLGTRGWETSEDIDRVISNAEIKGGYIQ